MNEELNSEMRHFGEEIKESLGYPHEDKPTRGHSATLDSKARGTILSLGAAGIILVAILIVLFTRGGSEVSREDLTALQARQDILEEKLTRLEQEALKGADFMKGKAELEGSVREIERSVEFLAIRVGRLAEKLDLQKEEPAPPQAETESLLPTQRKPLSYGKNTYHVVRPGDTLYKIARLYGTSVEELCRLNNISPARVIRPGEKLLIAPTASQ
jgi:nucleoid-associated protein YgaU